MDNILTVGKATMVKDILLGTLSPPLGERPQDHFMQSQADSGNRLDDSEAENLLMAIFQEVVESLSGDEKELLANFVGLGPQHEDPPRLDDVKEVMTRLVQDAIKALSEEGSGDPTKIAQSSSKSIAVMSIAQEILAEIRGLALQEAAPAKGTFLTHERLDAEVGKAPLVLAKQPHKNDMSVVDTITREVAEASVHYLKGLQNITANYGEPTSYRTEAILSAGGVNVVTPQVATILPMAAMLGEALHDSIQKAGENFTREISVSGKILNKSDMVLDTKLTQSVINRAFEVMEKDVKTNQQLEFSLKIHPKSMGEVNVVVNASREQINISVQGSPEAVDKIKNDVVYFSNQYDNMKWKLNDQDVKRDGGRQTSGDQHSQDNGAENLPEDAVKGNTIINLII